MPGGAGHLGLSTSVLLACVARMRAMTSCADIYVPSFPLLAQVAFINHDKGVNSDPFFSLKVPFVVEIPG